MPAFLWSRAGLEVEEEEEEEEKNPHGRHLRWGKAGKTWKPYRVYFSCWTALRNERIYGFWLRVSFI